MTFYQCPLLLADLSSVVWSCYNTCWKGVVIKINFTPPLYKISKLVMWTIKRTLRHRPNTSHAINSVAPVHRNWSLVNGPRHTLAEGDHQRFHDTFTFSPHSKAVLILNKYILSQDPNKLHRPNSAHTGYRPCHNLRSQEFASTPLFSWTTHPLLHLLLHIICKISIKIEQKVDPYFLYSFWYPSLYG